jgi:hypothetical protein
MVRNENAEAFVREALIAACGPALDAMLFSTTAASAANPPGILIGATNISPSTATDLFDAMASDVGALASAIGAYAGNGNLMLVANAAQAARYQMYSNTPFPMAISNTVAPGTVIAVALAALASAIEPVAVEAGSQPTIQFDDSNPSLASQTMNALQADAVVLRIRLPASWVIRNAQAVSVMTGVKW